MILFGEMKLNFVEQTPGLRGGSRATGTGVVKF